MIGETAALRISAAMERLAVSHLLERISPVLQEAYPKLRGQYLKSLIRILPKQNALVLSFPEAGEVRVTETPGGFYRIRCSRDVPEGQKSKTVEVSRTCKTLPDLLFQIDKIFERTAAVVLAVDLGVAEHMADEFHHYLTQSGNPEYFSSQQVGSLLGTYIVDTQESSDQPITEETWRSMTRSLSDKYDIDIDAVDLESALKQVGS